MSRNPISKTGLIASPKKKINRILRQPPTDHYYNSLFKCAITKPVQFSLRPFGGLFNPYSKGCSILCNHPGPNEVKNVVKQVKETWISEGKGHFLRDDNVHTKRSAYDGDACRDDDYDIPDHIPEEFFRRYTGSDSRPLTPTPTVASGRTRVSTGSHINARRCFTPDPVNSCAKERKQLILDLRRSHSQETLFWNASSELSPSIHAATEQKSASKGVGTTSPNPKNQRLCEQEARKKSAEKKALQLKQEAEAAANASPICTNENEEVEDEEDGQRRRGKRKKKAKTPTQTQTATFQVSQEPETQIATIGPDSPNPSTRPSLVPNGHNAPRLSLIAPDQMTVRSSSYRSSFISEDAIKYLRRGLNIDMVEASFERCMHKALKEAYRTIPPDKLNYESEALKKFKETVQFPDVDNEKWLQMPRKYTRNSARFSLPINTHDLATMTPFQYLSRHIWISDYRKQLYRFVFTKYLPEMEEPNAPPIGKRSVSQLALLADEQTNLDGGAEAARLGIDKDRTICYADMARALDDVLGFHGTLDKIEEIKEILLLSADDQPELNFRQWCGIVAFSERFLNQLSHKEDPCDEVEIVDFESLERKFSYVAVPEPLKHVLNLIKNQ